MNKAKRNYYISIIIAVITFILAIQYYLATRTTLGFSAPFGLMNIPLQGFILLFLITIVSIAFYLSKAEYKRYIKNDGSLKYELGAYQIMAEVKDKSIEIKILGSMDEINALRSGNAISVNLNRFNTPIRKDDTIIISLDNNSAAPFIACRVKETDALNKTIEIIKKDD